MKIGGTLLDSEPHRARIASQLAHLREEGHLCTVVHGGGKQVTEYLESHGISSHFINGLRVTTPKTMDAVVKVLAGTVNQELVGSLIQQRVRAVGLTGLDAGLVRAAQMSEELGAVGRVTGADPELLELLTASGFLPVIACLAGDAEGRFYNVNADSMAVACALAFRAERLLFLTDVAGVLDGGGHLVPVLTAAAACCLMQTGVAKGGMYAKLDASLAALAGGVGEIYISPGSEAGASGTAFTGALPGTRILGETQ